MITEIIKVPLRNEQDVGNAREEASYLAAHLGFDNLACAQIALAVSEICNNAIVHGGGGMAIIEAFNKNRAFKIRVTDSGIGIPNVENAMAEGYSTSRASLGIGMEVARRSMDKMEIVSVVDQGTTVILEKYLSLSPYPIEKGVVSIADDRYENNGDAYFYKEFSGDKVLMGVIDGVGQGFKARLFSESIKRFILENYTLPLDKIIKECDAVLSEHGFEFGAALGLALIDTSTHVMELCGLGDVHAHFYNQSFRSFAFPDGQLCNGELPFLRVHKIILPVDSTLILCTDGIKEKINPADLNWDNTAQWLANNTFNFFHKQHGDATVLVTKMSIDNV
ncbi:MAG: serine/threonine-protein kinase RsbT [Paraglaciecola sp.]|jgi:serine/threonine-protein kinase RsbT